MTATERSLDSSMLTSLRPHLDGLKRTTHGNVLYSQIQRGLKQFLLKNGRIDLVFVTFLHALLGKYAKDPACDPITRVRARFIQQHLAIYLPDNADVSPAETKTPDPGGHAPAPEEKPAPIPVVSGPKPVAEDKGKTEIPASVAPSSIPEQVVMAEKFGKLLESEHAALINMESPLGEINDLKKILIKGMNELIDERQELIQKLSSAGDYVKAMESDRERLRVELSQARKHGQSDELTGLPKRDVFVRQLEAEVGRVRRYGFALALALVDIDKLDTVNQRYGRQAGDAVLRCYSGEILAQFRTYDLVARYNGDEFAVLFPNTQKDGAMHALEKARKAAAETFIHLDGQNFPLPSFSSVLTQYSPGEPPEALLKRADDTLSQAKLTGFNRLVVALPTA